MARPKSLPKMAAPRRPNPSGKRPAPEDLPQVVILGRTNVGKSTLFNRVIGGREAIVHEERGVTRDRLIRTAQWEGLDFAITDQAGWEEKSDNPFATEIAAQIVQGLSEADVIWFVVDRKAGITAEDRAMAERVRPYLSKTPVILVANKVDAQEHEASLYEFYELGLGDPFPISAAHGIGIGDLLDATMPFLGTFPPPPSSEGEGSEEEDEAAEVEEGEELEAEGAAQAEIDPTITFAILGRQNVGKSSLFNKLVGSERAIVSEIAGTTRDAIDARFSWNDLPFCSIDTAGLKKKAKITGDVDFYAMRRAEQALQRAQVAVLVLDIGVGVTDMDKKIGNLIFEQYRACVIVANKWDLSAGEKGHQEEFIRHVREELHFLFFAPVVFTSALEGTGSKQLLEALVIAHRSYHYRLATGQMNATLQAIYDYNPPQVWRGKKGKIYYGTQAGTAPPHLILQVNSANHFIDSYRRYLYHALHEQLPLAGSPMKISYRSKKKRVEPAT